MKLTKEQQKVLWEIADAFGSLSRVWADGLGEALNNAGLLPMRDLIEAEAEYRHMAETGESLSEH